MVLSIALEPVGSVAFETVGLSVPAELGRGALMLVECVELAVFAALAMLVVFAASSVLVVVAAFAMPFVPVAPAVPVRPAVPSFLFLDHAWFCEDPSVYIREDAGVFDLLQTDAHTEGGKYHLLHRRLDDDRPPHLRQKILFYEAPSIPAACSCNQTTVR